MLSRRKFIAASGAALATPWLPGPIVAPPSRRILYFYGPLTDAKTTVLASSGFNVVVLAFLYVRRIAGKLHLTYNGTPVAAETSMATLIRRLHPGVKVMISIGGWGNRGIFEAIRDAGVEAFLEQFDREVVTPWGLDGIDLDLEPSLASENTPAGWHAVHDDLGMSLVALTNGYMRRHPTHFVTHAPISSVAAALYINDGKVRGVSGSILEACGTPTGNNLAWLNLQFYEAGDAPKNSNIPAYYHDELYAPLVSQTRATGIARPLDFLIPGFEPRFHQTLAVCQANLAGIAARCGAPPGGVFLWQYGQVATDIQIWSRGLEAALAGRAFRAERAAASGSGFPAGFLWGAGGSAYQTEGAADEPGKGVSVWDEFVRRRGVIADGQTGARACDFYHLYPGDIALMRELGLRAFRFSLAWTRILPDGTGAVHQAGLDYYRRLVDALLAAGIEPIVTLFHWDTPSALQQRSGWQTRDMVGWFGDYAAIVTRALSDRVRWWLTINEPRSFIGGGYLSGVQAPGLRLARKDSLAAAHVVLLAHGRAVQALRAHAAGPVQIGLPNDFSPALPVTAADEPAALAATFATPLNHFTAGRWWDENAWWHEPVYAGSYPVEAMAALGPDAPALAAGDMELIRQPLDFMGTNIYGGRRVTTGPNGEAISQPQPPGAPATAFGWAVTPEVAYWAPRWLHQRYKLPVFITENGCSTRDWVSLDGLVHDPQRTDFIERHLQFLQKAVTEGTPVLGYLHWALLDNFEWQAGYTQRFGLIYVNFPDGQRIVKDSARAYARLIAGG